MGYLAASTLTWPCPLPTSGGHVSHHHPTLVSTHQRRQTLNEGCPCPCAAADMQERCMDRTSGHVRTAHDMQRTVLMSFKASRPDPPISLLCSSIASRSQPSLRMLASPIRIVVSERSPERVRISEGGSGDLLMQASGPQLLIVGG